MTHRPNQPDRSIDRTLAALRSAAPPEEMESRILARLAQRQPAPDPMWSRLAALLPQSAWLRGALTGAALATAACAVAFFLTRAPHAPVTANHSAAPPAQTGPAVTNVALNTGQPCLRPTHARVPHPGSAWVENRATADGVPHSSRSYRDEWEERVPHPNSAWVGGATTTSHAPHLIPASFAPSHPAPPAPLTAQERALVQLVRTATPAELAALNPAAQEKADADREADFQKFFAPSPELLAAEEAAQNAAKEAQN